MSDGFPKMREIGIGDMVNVSLPAHTWIGFIASFSACQDYTCSHAAAIAMAAQKALIDPVFLKEREAEMERMAAQHHTMLSNMIPGLPGPQVPPDLSGMEETGEGS